MSRLFFGLLNSLGRERLPSKRNVFSKVNQFARANSTKVIYQQHSSMLSSNFNCLCGLKQDQLFKFPEHLNLIFSGLEKLIPAENIGIVDKNLPHLCPFNFPNKILGNIICSEEFMVSILDNTNNDNVYLMGSLLKKRRKKMNRQKYKKRRKRDRFRREALKNLREKKHQRKERAAARKQLTLSKMVVKVISKRRARYLSHKLLPGFVKGQNLN